jgi:hypothetical protein
VEWWRRVTPRSKLTRLGRHAWEDTHGRTRTGIGWKASNSGKPREHQVFTPYVHGEVPGRLDIRSLPTCTDVHGEVFGAQRGLWWAVLGSVLSVHSLRARTCTEMSILGLGVAQRGRKGSLMHTPGIGVHSLHARRGRDVPR